MCSLGSQGSSSDVVPRHVCTARDVAGEAIIVANKSNANVQFSGFLCIQDACRCAVMYWLQYGAVFVPWRAITSMHRSQQHHFSRLRDFVQVRGQCFSRAYHAVDNCRWLCSKTELERVINRSDDTQGT